MTSQMYISNMMSQIPSINNMNGQSKTKPPLPPLNVKSSNNQNSRNQIDTSNYIPRHLSQQQVQFPPIQRLSTPKSSHESEKSVIDIFNPTLGHMPPRVHKNSGSLSDFFEAPMSAKHTANGNDPFSLRDRLRQTLQDTSQMMRIDNVNLL